MPYYKQVGCLLLQWETESELVTAKEVFNNMDVLE